MSRTMTGRQWRVITNVTEVTWSMARCSAPRSESRNELLFERAELTMAVRGRKPHYPIDEITGRHWRELSERASIGRPWDRMQTLFSETPAAAAAKSRKQT
jgi:hypothetical protein